MAQLLYYKNLCKEDLWLDCADKLTAMIQNIIEFAKLIPGFMRLSQDDQVGIWSNGLTHKSSTAFDKNDKNLVQLQRSKSFQKYLSILQTRLQACNSVLESCFLKSTIV